MSAGLQANEIIIVRRRASLETDSVKGGVWKIAFADFMTAMMAFFLVMWLINVTDESVRKGVAQYFNPVKLASTTQTRKGLNDPDVPGPEVTNPAKIDAQMETTPDPDGSPGAANGSDATGSMPLRDGLVAGRRAGEFNPTLSEAQLFSDPYAVLDELVGTLGDQLEAGVAPETEGIGQQQTEGALGGDAFRDPFDPMYWQFLPGRKTSVQEGGPAASVTGQTAIGTVAFEAPATGEEGETPAQPQPQGTAAGQTPETQPDAPLTAAAVPQPKEGVAPATVTEAVAAAPQQAPVAEASTPPAPEAAKAETAEAETAEAAQAASRTEAAAAEIREAITSSANGPLAETASRIEVSRQDGGVLISLTDAENFGMFAVGSAEPRPELVKLMERIGAVLSSRPGKIIIRGHTDARPFRSASNDNWRLSTSRAHMALYMLVRGGVEAGRIERVEGYADRELKQAEDPYAPANRRIEIFLMEEGA